MRREEFNGRLKRKIGTNEGRSEHVQSGGFLLPAWQKPGAQDRLYKAAFIGEGISMRTIILGIACLSLVHAEPRRWKLHPALDAAVERIKIGELTSVLLPDPVIGASDEQARQDYLKAQRAHDKEGIQELTDAAKIAVLAPATEVRVLERNEADLDELMKTVHQLVDLDIQTYKYCMTRRSAAGLDLEPCGHLTFDKTYNTRMSECLSDTTPENYVDSHVLVLVRVLTGKESGKRLWVAYGALMRPSHPDPPSKP